MTDQAGGNAEYIEIAYVRKPVGLKGWCGISVHGRTLLNLSLPFPLYIGKDEKSLNDIVLHAVRPASGGYQCLFEGVEDRENAESFRGCRIFIRKKHLTSLDKKEFYHFELEGMNVYDSEGNEQLGTVERIYNYPSVDALEILKKDGRTITVPFTKDVVKEIDRDNRAVFIYASQLEDIL